MNCHMCKVDKLSREYPQVPLTEDCDHATLICMRCVLKFVAEHQMCPHKQCAAKVPPASSSVKDMETRLAYLFPMYQPQFDITPPTGDVQANIRISTLTGESIVVPYKPTQTICDLKKLIRQRKGHEESKQKLLFVGKELNVHRENGSLTQLQDFNIQAQQTIHLVVLLYAIPENFNHVIFNLFWGYPTSGPDYLDASCLAFSGSAFSFHVDFNRTNSNGICHSGDIMDDSKRQGHHTINVKLKEIPQNITHLFFTLSAWASPNISKYPNPSLRFYEASNKKKNLCSTAFNHARHSQAVVMCIVSRKGGSWQIFDSGKLSAGNANNYQPIITTIQSILEQGV